MVIHDLNMASRFSDKLLFLKNGKVFSSGKPDAILTKDNIKSVYKIEVSIVNINDHPCFVPTKVADEKIESRNELII
jgi:iron complex transport system ATP-binding protein